MKNKILVIFIFSILILFCLSISCFASGFDDYPTVPILNEINGVDISNFNNHSLIYSSTDAIILKVVYFPKDYLEPSFYIWNDDSFIISIEGDGQPQEFYYQNYRFDSKLNSWNISSNGSCTSFKKFGLSDYTFYASTVDIYESDLTTLFFQQTPVTEPATVLTPILEKVEMKEPITTTIVGLAKLLIPLLICLLGFWKAWRLLLKIFHKS